MKENINVFEYAPQISELLGKGILLNTQGDRFNSMVIGWGHIGRIWNRPTFVVYVRQSRFTKPQLDKTREFTISVPLNGIQPKINQVCGSQSGYDVDKVREAGLTLEEPRTIHTPGIREYPLTIECRVLYQQDQDMAEIPADICERSYPKVNDGDTDLTAHDLHTCYIGEIVDAYIIR